MLVNEIKKEGFILLNQSQFNESDMAATNTIELL